MPPSLLFDISSIDLNAELFDQEGVRAINPQRGDMEHLNAIVWADTENRRIIGRKDVRSTEFWVPGHIPGRPLFPGVLMIEAAAQVASFYTKKYVGWEGFIGFGGTGETKFRGQVVPDCTMYILTQLTWARHRRIACNVQGLVNGEMVFETSIIGVQF